MKKSEEEYRSLFVNMLDGYAYQKIVLDEENKPVDFVYLDVNDGFEVLTGLKKENVVGKKITEVIPGRVEAYPELLEIFGRVALTGKGEDFEIEFKTLERWLHISVYSPRKGYFITISENITERKRAEEAIENLARFPSENPNPVLRIAKDGVILYVNESAKSLLSEWKREVGQSAPDSWTQKVTTSFTSGSSLRFEIEHLDRVF